MKYYLLGIKGSGMSSLASILKDLNHDVSGCDIDKYVFTQQTLEEKKINVYTFEDNNFDNTYDELIVGNVFNSDNEVYKLAQKYNIKITKYLDFLNELTSKYKTISVCGTNGKTTTTSLLDQALCDEKIMTLIGDSRGHSNIDPNYFVLESCEYKNNFLNYNPEIVLINNVEMDHPDFFKDINQVNELFLKFASKAKTVIVNIDDENCNTIKNSLNNNVVTFSICKKADVFLQNIIEDKKGYICDVHYGDKVYKEVLLPFVGKHMLYNTVATLCVCYYLEKDFNNVLNNMCEFKGAKRRFETTIINKDNDIVVIDDYAHHPTSISLTLNAIRQKYDDYYLTAIFQAHTYSRAKEFHKEFASSLEIADSIYIDEIFGSAREQKSEINENIIKDDIQKEKLVLNINDISKNNKKHVIALLGAGDVDVKYKELITNMFKGV